MPSAVRVSVRDLSKHYGAVPAVQGVSFDLAPGEILGLLGPNGAGKTSTVECIVGLRKPNTGDVLFNEYSILRDQPRIQELVGAQLQSSTLQDKITPRQALQLFASFYATPANVSELLERFGLREKAASPFETLSGGQKQRLFLALAFVNRPSVLVLDEPSTGLDPRMRREVHEQIRAAKQEGCSVLLCTHDLHEAAVLCDRVGLIDRGRLVALGTPAELVAASKTPPRVQVLQPTLEDVYFELTGRNLSDGDAAEAST
jgi:ABC-2 type transport system ATP-binding protein